MMHWLEKWRLEHGVTRAGLAEMADCSHGIIGLLEDQHNAVTHWKIANRIASATGATEDQRDSIVPRAYRGTLGPVPEYTRRNAKRPKKPLTGNGLKKTAYNAVEVVCIDPQGNELGRYASMMAAEAKIGCSAMYIRDRCKRKLQKGEEFLYGYTFRFAHEWDLMTPEERMAALGQNSTEKRKTKREKEPRPYRREIVALNEQGMVLKRFQTQLAAAVYYDCSKRHVGDRCNRQVRPEANEFRLCGCTFRYRDDWDAMTPEEQMRDMQKAKQKIRRAV